MKTWAESSGMIPEKQSGFQPRRSTLDTLASISQRALDNLQKPTPERTLLVAVDFIAAFDRVWKVGLLRDLASWNLPNRCLVWLRAWLSVRRGTVKWNDTIGRFKVFREGVRKAARSPPLFCFATASLPRAIQTDAPEVVTDLFADDFTLAATWRTPDKAAASIQPVLSSASE